MLLKYFWEFEKVLLVCMLAGVKFDQIVKVFSGQKMSRQNLALSFKKMR